MSELYKQSGVDVGKANELTRQIREKTRLKNIGRFSALCEHPLLPDYYMVTTVDGIGTKILPLLARKDFKTIANDVIAMNLNDLACSGAAAISFSDYIALNSIEPQHISEIIKEISTQLQQYGCILASGETSEMKDLIPTEKMDIAGFAVGLVKKENVLPAEDIRAGDVIIGLVSSGAHANGFSLIRKLYDEQKLTEAEFEQMLAPTTIYINEIVELAGMKLIKSAANITGGGLEHNIRRALPEDTVFMADLDTIPSQPIFEKLYELCGDECYDIFNMGLGFCVIVDKTNVDTVMQKLAKYKPFIFGEVLKA